MTKGDRQAIVDCDLFLFHDIHILFPRAQGIVGCAPLLPDHISVPSMSICCSG